MFQETPDTQDIILHNKLEKLENILTAAGGARRSLKRRVSTAPIQSKYTFNHFLYKINLKSITAMVSSEIKDSQTFTVGWDYMVTEVQVNI